MDSAALAPRDSPVWLPPIVVRGQQVTDGDAEVVERTAVRAQVDRIAQVLGIAPPGEPER